MTNEQIVWAHRVALAKDGVIGYTGRMLTYIDTASGTETKVAEPEPLYTFAAWLELGYSIKKGEHAVAKFAIWTPTKKKKEDEEPGTVQAGRPQMFLKMSNFFTMSQVERKKK